MLLYKYLPLVYARALVERGEVLFRSLSYFRRQEHAARGDEVEGVHIDAPETGITIRNLTRGFATVGAYRFLNSIDQDRVFAFCCSRRFHGELFETFCADACVRIRDPDVFFLRCRTAARRHFAIEKPGLIHRAVEYFDPARAATMSVKEPRNLPFFKHHAFSDQDEYRAVFASKGGFKLLQRIVQPQFTFADEIQAARPVELLLRVGPLNDVVELVEANEPVDV